jgi:hypothetical protein
MHRKLHVDTLNLIPTFKIYVFSYSRQTDEQTDGDIHTLALRNLFSAVLEKFLLPLNALNMYGTIHSARVSFVIHVNIK